MAEIRRENHLGWCWNPVIWRDATPSEQVLALQEDTNLSDLNDVSWKKPPNPQSGAPSHNDGTIWFISLCQLIG